MNDKIAKKVRKYTRRNFLEYVNEVRTWPFINRWRYCWYILFSRKPKIQKVSKHKVLKERRPVSSQ